MTQETFQLLVFIVIFLLIVFLITRWFWTWYWKINKRVDGITEMVSLLENIDEKLEILNFI